MKKFLFATLLAALLCIPWTQLRADVSFLYEGFESGSLPSGWTTEGQGTWSVATGVSNYYPSAAFAGNYNAQCVHASTGNVTKLITPVIDLSSQTSVVLSFAYVNYPWGGDVEEIRVYYRTSSTDTWHSIAELTSGVTVWTEAEYTLSTGLSATYQLAFEVTDNWGHGAGIDEVNVGLPPTCFPVTDLEVSEITSTGADISWMASGHGETQYQYLCIPATSTPDWSNATLLSYTSETLSGLQPNTNYTVYVRSYCDSTDQSKAVSATFKTLCAAVTAESLGTISFETSEGFTGSSYSPSTTDGIGNCWTSGNLQNPTGTSYIPYVKINSSYSTTTYARTGSQCIYINAYTSSYTTADSAYAIMPQMTFTGSITSYEAHFYMRKESTSTYSSYNDTLWVGIVSDPSDLSDLEIVGYGVNTTTTHAQQIVTFGSYTGGTTGYVVFLAAVDQNATGYSSSSKYASFYVDDIQIVKGRATTTPVVDSIYNITATTADVAFSGSNATSYRIMAATELVDDPEAYTNWAVDTVVTASPATINVQSATRYYLYVQGYGSIDTSFISNPAAQFVSGCVVVTSFPWTENFESEANGVFNKPCWTNVHADGPGSYLAQISTSSMGENTTHQLYFRDQSATTYTIVSTPELNIPTAGAYEFNIDVYRGSGYTDKTLEGVQVIVENTNGGYDTTFIPRVYSNTAGVGAETEADTWYTYTIALPKAGIQRVILRGCNEYGTSTYMDNLRVRKTPTCFKVDSVELRDNQATQATIGWRLTTASKYQVVLTNVKINPDTLANVPASAIVFNDSTAAAVDTLTITGLTAATKYFVYVRGLCTDEIGEWSRGINFRTACSIYTISKTDIYSEGFESLDDASQEVPCWDILTTSTTYPQVAANTQYRPYAHTGNNCWSFGTYSGTNDTTYMVMPETTNPVNTLRLKFWVRGMYSSADGNDSILVGVMTDAADRSTFTRLYEYQATNNDGYELIDVDFGEYTGANGRIAVVRVPVGIASWYSTAYYGSMLDDFTIELAPTCKKVQDIAASNLTKNSAQLSWTSTTASNYEVIVADQSIDPAAIDSAAQTHIVFNDTAVVADSVSVTGLVAMTNYYAYVRGNCGGGDISEWSKEFSFATAAALPYVQNFNGTEFPSEMKEYTCNYHVDSLIAGTDRLIDYSGAWQPNTYIASDTATVKFNMYGGSNFKYFATPVFEFNGVDSVVLSFDACKRAYNSSIAASDDTNYDDVFYVMVANPELTQFTTVATWGNDTLGKCDYSLRDDIGQYFGIPEGVDLSDLQGNYRIVFAAGSAEANDDYDLHIDNVMIYTPAELEVISDDATRGTVTGSCVTYVGAEVEITATANENSKFYMWSNGSTDATTIYTVASTKDTVTAYFLADSVDWVITSADTTMGTVTGSGRYATLDTVTITATPKTGYRFVAWSDGDVDSVRTFLVVEDFSLVATFEELYFAYDVHSADSTMGLVGEDTVYVEGIVGVAVYGTTMKFVAAPKAGYEFTGWSNGVTTLNFDLVLTSDTMVVANFKAVATSVEDVEAAEYVAYTEGSRINVVGAENHAVSVIDATGRVVAIVENAEHTENFSVNVPGVYFIRVSGMKSTSVIVK